MVIKLINKYIFLFSFIHLTILGCNNKNSELQKKIDQKFIERGQLYKPRTRHLNTNGQPQFTNRLFLESSPYLLQHAHNPVNWYPWGDEAFEAAKKNNLPILLSVGYSTCHWCHVMEEESFEDEEIAKIINTSYIPIKIDREERPDLDAIYMAAVQALTGTGGWPMTLWLTPEKKPFYASTYLPPRNGDRGIKVGFLTLLLELKKVYDQGPEKIKNASTELTNIIKTQLEDNKLGEIPTTESINNALAFYTKNFDKAHGGLLGNPKFPSSLPIRLLLHQNRNSMAIKTLLKMSYGGIYDHIGGGFHRYSTDEKWLIPHFEKMLYDNAQLAMSYLDGYQVTKNKDLKQICIETLDYLLKDMKSEDGAFYSATDADSIGPTGKREEGYYFIWNYEELKKLLTKDEFVFFKTLYNVTPQGNFENNQNILNVNKSVESKTINLLGPIKEKLYRQRNLRPPPLRDEKIITSWNGLTISALSKAGSAFNEDKYINSAKLAAHFLWDNLFIKGTLYRSFKDNRASQIGFLDDYAFYIAGLIDLYEATGEIVWLKNAISLDQILNEKFEDKINGGFFMTGSDHETMLAKEKPAYDGAEPSGNSIQVMNLLRLYEFTTKESYRERAEKSFKQFSNRLKKNPTALSEMLMALDYFLNKPKEIILVFPNKKTMNNSDLINTLNENFVPSKIVVKVIEGENLKDQSLIIPLLEGKVAIDGKSTAYVCKNKICKLPTQSPKELEAQLKL